MKNILKFLCVTLIIAIIYMNLFSISHAKFNMAYLYGNYDYISLVERANGALNEVSPSYFDLDENGSLKLNTVDTNLVKTMHEKGITVVPFLSNHWDRNVGRKALENREKLASRIAECINKYNLDGVNVDLENLTELDRENYVELVRLLREKIPTNKTVSVALAANPNGWTKGWQGSYDYEKLGKIADYVLLMAYDEHYEGGEAGPIAGIEFVEDSIKYALKNIPSEKIVLGVPFFGRYWNRGTGLGGYGVRSTKIQDIISKYTSEIVYDEINESVKATVVIKDGDTYPVINGKTLITGIYTFWYENERSLTAKLKLVNKYNLKGTGSWSLGQETADTWNYYEKALNNEKQEEIKTGMFYDVPDDYWAHDTIYLAKEKGWVTGRSETYFEPEGSMTRAEFATILTRILGYKYQNEGDYYLDIKKHWARISINAVTQSHLMEGYNNSLFYPDNSITREEVAKVIYLIVNCGESSKIKSFSDVSKDRWSYEYIQKLSELGIINGYEDGTFKPQNPIKRSEMVTILKRIFVSN